MALTRRNTTTTTTASELSKQAQAMHDAFKPGTAKIEAAVRASLTTPPDYRLGQAEYERLSASIRISKTTLDDNAVEHGQLYLEIAERSALAMSHADQAKADLAVADALIARNKRQEPCEKAPTDKAVEAHVLLHSDHAAAQAALSAAVAVSGRWRALERSFEHRKSMIRELTGLYAAGYWTSSGTIGPRAAVATAAAERNREALADARSRRNVQE